MKKTISILISITLINLLFLSGCSSNNDDTVIINSEYYEVADHDWTPYGNSNYNGEYYLYNDNSKTVFAKSEDNRLFDGIIYHNLNDIYPDISMTDRIDKIVFERESKQIVLDSNIADILINELSNTNKSNLETVPANSATIKVYINVFYQNYPAYQNEFAICYSNNNELGFIYCETEKNTNSFGKGNMALFSDDQLINYIESLNLL